MRIMQVQGYTHLTGARLHTCHPSATHASVHTRVRSTTGQPGVKEEWQHSAAHLHMVRAYFTLCVLALRLGSALADCDESLLRSICASSSAASTTCAICVGQHQHELRVAGCGPVDVERYCSDGGVGVYVSSNDGSDANDGRSPTTALRTLDAAWPAVRRLKASFLLLDGVFRLAETVTLNSPYAGLRIDRWPGRPAPVISGSAQLPSSGWTPSASEPGVWRVGLTATQAAALDGAGAILAGGKRRTVVRTPMFHWNASLNEDKNAEENSLGFVYQHSSIDPEWSLSPASLQRWTVAAFHSWNKAYHKVKAVFPHNNTILFQAHARFGYGMYEYCSKERWYIENLPELPLPAGSGTWKASATELLYAPMPGEDLHGHTVIEVPAPYTAYATFVYRICM